MRWFFAKALHVSAGLDGTALPIRCAPLHELVFHAPACPTTPPPPCPGHAWAWPDAGSLRAILYCEGTRYLWRRTT